MARYNAMEEIFTEIEVLGKPALFHDMRIDRNTVPKGLYLYEIRHDDKGWGNPVRIAKGIMREGTAGQSKNFRKSIRLLRRKKRNRKDRGKRIGKET